VRNKAVKNKCYVLIATSLALALPAAAQAPGKVGVISMQTAIVGTKDGQKAANEIQSRFTPKKAELDKRQSDITQLQDQLNRSRNTMSEEAQQKLVREIDQKTKALTRDTEDARAELDQEEQKIMNELGGRIMAVLDKYAKDNGYTVIVDVSSPQTPVLWRAESIDVTKEVIEMYDKNAPSAASTPAAAKPAAVKPAARTTAPPPAIPAGKTAPSK
jgi:outer membrane protein